MKLRTYLDTLPRGGVADFAKEIGVSPVYLSQIAAELDGREPSPTLCVVIERNSKAAVTRQDLRKDWQAIWPELAEPAFTKSRKPKGEHATASDVIPRLDYVDLVIDDVLPDERKRDLVAIGKAKKANTNHSNTSDGKA